MNQHYGTLVIQPRHIAPKFTIPNWRGPFGEQGIMKRWEKVAEDLYIMFGLKFRVINHGKEPENEVEWAELESGTGNKYWATLETES